MRGKIIILSIIIIAVPILKLSAADLAKSLSGKILLQVEENGEAWYVNPADGQRYYLGRPADAFNLMRDLGGGITNKNLAKIPIAIDSISETNIDTDNDNFTDYTELKTGFNPYGESRLPIDTNFAKKQSGKILLQVEENGEAWYVNPTDGKRYYLGRPSDAFNLMRKLGLGITNANLQKIPSNSLVKNAVLPNNSNTSATGQNIGNKNLEIEKKIQVLVNAERQKYGLNPTAWNDELANVAREHSQNLTKENIAFVDVDEICSFPMIHHEGFDFGTTHSDRLNNRGVYYFSSAAENIALNSQSDKMFTYKEGTPLGSFLDNCQAEIQQYENEFKQKVDNEPDKNKKLEIIRAEIKKRTEQFNKYKQLDNYEYDAEIVPLNSDAVLDNIVQGWMNSPGHRKNILTPDFDEGGVGIAQIENYIIATQLFIKRAECGYQTGLCCQKQGYYPYCFVNLACENMKCK